MSISFLRTESTNGEIVDKVKQMKPFLLLVVGKGEPVEQSGSKGRLFQHDPSLRMKTTYDNQPLRVVSHINLLILY
jgi:hypothetical protein